MNLKNICCKVFSPYNFFSHTIPENAMGTITTILKGLKFLQNRNIAATFRNKAFNTNYKNGLKTRDKLLDFRP